MLDIFNLFKMKNIKLLLLFILAGSVSFSIALWLYSTKNSLAASEYIIASLVLMVVVFSIAIGVKKIKNIRKGYPSDDELSESIKAKAAAKSYLYSIYMWTGILFFVNNKNLEAETLIGVGILGMGIIFIGFWIYYSRIGTSLK